MRTIITYILLMLATSSRAQTIDNTLSYSTMSSDYYVRFTYDNDFFTATDGNYTQGIQLEYAHPVFKKAFYRKALLTPFKARVISSIAIEHNAYTPTNIVPDVILYGDRPYTAALMLRLYNIGIDTVQNRRFSSALSLGVMGPHASGKWMQEGIHRGLDNVQPGGWQYQLKNDVVANYTVNYEHRLLSAGNNFLLNAVGSGSVGTMNDKLSIGFNFMAGTYNDPYGVPNKRKFRVHVYAQPQASVIAYNALLQGGLFTKDNIYAIPAKDIQRLVFSGRAGIVFNIAGIYLEHFYAISTKEFSTHKPFYWGGVQMGFAF